MKIPNLNPTEKAVLLYLNDHDGSSPPDVATALALPLCAVDDAFDRLCSLGLIEPESL